MADADEDVIPRNGPDLGETDLSDETQDFRFLASVSTEDAKIPKRGEKDFEPHQTALQSNTLAASRAAMHAALCFQRVHAQKRYNVAIYHPETNMAYTENPKGQLFKAMGKAVVASGRDFVPAGAGSMDVRWPADGDEDDGLGVPMSLQGAYAAFIGLEGDVGGSLTFERYSVYTALKRMGAQGPSTSSARSKLPHYLSYLETRLTHLQKSDPGPPDFRIAVINARETSIPTLAQLGALLDTTPYAPPVQDAQLYVKLRNGYKNVILAIVDQGVTSYLRVADAGFGNEKLYARKSKPPGGKKGGGGRGKGVAKAPALRPDKVYLVSDTSGGMPGHKRQRTSSSTFVDAQTAQALLSSSNSPADKARILDVATSTPPLGHAARQNELRWVKYVAARETLEMLRYRSPAEILNMMQPSVAAQPSIMAQTASLSFLTPKQEHKSIMPSQGGMSSTTSSAIKSADAEVEPQLGQRGASGNPILATSDGGLNVGSASTDYKGQANHLDNKPFMHASSPILGSQSDNVVAGTPGYQYNEYMSVGTDGSTKFIGSGHQIPPSPKPHPSFSLNFAPSIGTPKTAAAAANAEAKPKKKEAPRPRKKAARKKGQAVAPINAAEATEPSGFTGLVKLKTAASKQGQNEAPTSAATEATGRLEYSVPADAKTAEALSELLEEGKVVYDQKRDFIRLTAEILPALCLGRCWSHSEDGTARVPLLNAQMLDPRSTPMRRPPKR
ncbi:tRNA-splicing endonuclease subunit sen54 [Taxawa tesnikishii (nom. ined.)]|nr:tRNA-splicing endonuclease subunit sen54 [Dothideales sp. JES 119]